MINLSKQLYSYKGEIEKSLISVANSSIIISKNATKSGGFKIKLNYIYKKC